jgi:DNA-binding response OmpR family regulator
VGPVWPRGEGLIAIHADTRETFETLSDACRAGGYAAVWYPQDELVAASGVVAALADGISCDESGLRSLRCAAERHRPAPVIALLDFVRRQDYELALAEGVRAVLAKPFLVYDLLWHLDNAIRQASRSRGGQAAPGDNRAIKAITPLS